jgi:hypothetical protein
LLHTRRVANKVILDFHDPIRAVGDVLSPHPKEPVMPWTEKTPLPSASNFVAACDAPAAGSSYWIYAIGGGVWPGTGAVAKPPTVYGYDGSGWSQVVSPIGDFLGYQGGFAATSGAGGLHVLGGISTGTGYPVKTHQIYDAAANA